MKKFLPVFLSFVGLFLAGCLPVERFWWSPDGRHAVVLHDQTLHLVDEAGAKRQLIESEGSEAAETFFDVVEWFANGEQFLAHRVRTFDEWADARSNLPKAEAERIEQLAEGVPGVLAAAVLVAGDAERPESLLDRIPGADSDLLRNAFFLALETRPEEVRQALANAPRSLADLEKERDEIDGFLVHQIVLFRLPEEEKSPEVILSSSEAIQSPVLSPNGKTIAFSRKQERGNLYSIELISSKGGQPTAVAGGAHNTVAWTDDGRSLVFMTPAANEGILKQIKRVTVLEESGEPIGQKKQQTMNLAAAVVPFSPRIEKLPGDQFLFASQSGGFPVANSEAVYEAHLYRVSAEGGAVDRIPTSPGALPMNLGFFVASPDGKRVAVVESDTDAVAVVEIETGRTELVSPAHPDWRCRTLPAWKNNEELTFAAPDESTGIVQWKLWSADGDEQVLNQDWPAGTTVDWLEKKEEP